MGIEKIRLIGILILLQKKRLTLEMEHLFNAKQYN